MKNVTTILDEGVAARVGAQAAVQGKTLSRFISDLLEREVGRGDNKTDLEDIYGERINELLRRNEHSRTRDR